MTLPTLNGFTKKVSNLLDKPNTQMTSAELKAWFDSAPEELRVFLNSSLSKIDTDFALKSEINGVVLGQILDGSLTDAKLSNTAGQIKDRVANFIVQKGVANGLATLGSDSKLPSSQLGISIKTGTISNGGTIPQTAGYANYIYFVSINNVIYKFFNGSGSYDTNFYCSVNQSTRVVTVKTSYAGDYAGTANYIEIAW